MSRQGRKIGLTGPPVLPNVKIYGAPRFTLMEAVFAVMAGLVPATRFFL